jgi:hypothetical protein
VIGTALEGCANRPAEIKSAAPHRVSRLMAAAVSHPSANVLIGSLLL